jgi:hypothetical protein
MGGLAALRRGADAELSLTFQAQAAGLQPALDRLRARAAAIFEKEQEYVVGAAQYAQSQARQDLYITKNGCAFTLYLSCAQSIDVCTCCALCAQFPDTDLPGGLQHCSCIDHRRPNARTMRSCICTQTARLAPQRWQERE